MKYRKIDNNGDYTFGNNADDFYTDETAVAQAISTSVKLLLNEWWEDTSIGLPLFQHIVGSNGSPESIKGADLLVQQQIQKVQGVQKISAYNSSYANRKYTVSVTVQTIYGGTATQEVIFN